MARRSAQADPAERAVVLGFAAARQHPMLAPIGRALHLARRPFDGLPHHGWAVVDGERGVVWVHPTRLAEPEQWAWVFAHLMLHLGFGHDQVDSHFCDAASTTAADAIVCRFQQTVKLGTDPLNVTSVWPSGDEAGLATRWRRSEIPPEYTDAGVAGGEPCVFRSPRAPHARAPHDWTRLFAGGLTSAVAAALDVAGGARQSPHDPSNGRLPPWQLARRWFLSAYPLLGSTMATLTVVADAELCRGRDIPVAAVNPGAGELYINPLAHLTEQEWRFVLAHEALHAGLNHHTRAGGRDHYLFNLAADFVING